MPHRSGLKAPFGQGERTLDDQRVILVTQGTFEHNVEKIIVPTLEAYKNDPATMVIVPTGGLGTGALRRCYPQPHFLTEEFIERPMPYVSVYVTNSGYGGVMLSLQHQRPIIVATVHEGKDAIAARVQHNRVGLDLRTETPKSAQIRRAVPTILADATYRQRARQLSAEFSRYSPKELVARYINQLMNRPGRQVANGGLSPLDDKPRSIVRLDSRQSDLPGSLR